MNKKIKLQERKLSQESQVSVELRKRYDEMKRKLEQSNSERVSATQQYKDLFQVFTTMRKALVVSVQKTKKLEQDNKSIDSRARKAEEKQRQSDLLNDQFESEI